MEEKGKQEKDEKTEEDKAKDKGDTPKEDAQNIQDVIVSRASPSHAKQDSQKDFVTTDDIPSNSTQKINPLSEEDIKKLHLESTNIGMPCSNHILVRIDESQKAKIASIEEQQKDTSIVPPMVVEIKEKESQELIKDQGVNLEKKYEPTSAPSTMPKIVFEIKENEAEKPVT